MSCAVVWLSLVERYIRDVEVAGSNPVTAIKRNSITEFRFFISIYSVAYRWWTFCKELRIAMPWKWKGEEGTDMETWFYVVDSIDGDYANLKRTDIESDDLKLVARALLPAEIVVGSHLKYEFMQYSLMP